MTLSAESLNRGLATVRYLFDLAVQQSRQPGLRRGVALLSFHDAVEMFLVLGLQQHDLYHANRQYRFSDYWSELAKAPANVNVTLQGPLESLNRVRVQFKHHAISPSPNAVEDARVHVRDFFTENTPIVFGGLNFEDVSLVSAISAFDRPRAYLLVAERLMTEEQYDDALGKIAFAFELLLRDYDAPRPVRARRSRYPSARDWHRLRLDRLDMRGGRGRLLPREIADQLRAFADQVRDGLTLIDLTLKLVGLGIDYERYLRFTGLVPAVVFLGQDPTGWGRTEWHGDTPPTLEECRFCFDFVIDSALRLQEVQYGAYGS